MSTFKVLTLNCNGIADSFKRKDVFDKIRQLDCNIFMLQETHLKQTEETFIRSGWGFQVILAGNSSNAGGTAILFKNNFEYSVSRVVTDPNGNYIIAEINCMNRKITLVNIYGPSYGDNDRFFENINDILNDFDENYILIGGDFNCVLDLNKDRKNYTSMNNRPNSRAKILDIMGKYNLVDIYRNLNPDKEMFTWRKFNQNKQARLDYFLLSNDLTNEVKEVKTINRYKSDHSPVIITLNKNSFIRERTFWKFNNSLLQDQGYVEMVRSVITETKKQYSNLVYNHDSIDQIPLNDLSLQIEDDLFLETMLMNIRGKTISYASRKKKIETQREKELENNIMELESKYSETRQQEISNLKLELETIREKKAQGMITRSKANWLKQGEKLTSTF